ncbi:hypothetical protein QBC35DRAFT_513483 [Podospora australis]|uniref:UmuC domain-containing protein n=1 Tax=Podospora australis TaxID=1536484 RepID=A0AAN6WZL0_9PEZI|nr:hypothetical protein QBC35DRAFT_513483 [Podospora australis]
MENRQPALKSQALGIKQKGILATCNYVARRRGVKKLMLISEAKKICPDLVLVDGEDLSPFRDVSKRLYALLRSYSWNGKTERLGLDETFLDVTDMVAYNMELLNKNDLHRSYFCLSQTDPEKGFAFDATSFSGCVYGNDSDNDTYDEAGGLVSSTYTDDALRIRLLLASHLAHYLRMKIEDEGYTTACGIATNKVLAKLVGDKNKPRNQTTLLAPREEDVYSFMDQHSLRKVPGVGSRTTRKLEAFVLGKDPDPDVHSMECAITVGQVRNHPEISRPTLERLLGGPGSEKGIGGKVWALIHGADDYEVKPARDVPTQISIEDTYRGLNEPSEIQRELISISISLLRRMQVDLTDEPEDTTQPLQETGSTPRSGSTSVTTTRKWLAQPKTLRLTTRPYTPPSENKPYNWARASKSCPLPSFVFNLSLPLATIAEKLVTESLLPLFRQLNSAKRGWSIGLLNVCVTNMTGAAVEVGGSAARDIASMFKQQSTVLREFTAYNDSDDRGSTDRIPEYTDALCSTASSHKYEDEYDYDEEDEADNDGDDWADHTPEEEGSRCPVCAHFIPLFAIAAHERYHNSVD